MDMGRFLPSSFVSQWNNPVVSIQKGIVQFDGSESSRAAPSPDWLAALGKPVGVYWFKSPNMSSAIQMHYFPNMLDNKSWVRVFSSPYASTATINLLGNNIDFRGLCVQRNDISIRNYGYLSANALYNTRGDTTTATSGPLSGYRIFLGYAGGHGFYTTGQNPCSWSTASGSIGAGYDGATCGSGLNDLRWGTGNGSGPTYDNRSGTWEHWIWWPTP